MANKEYSQMAIDTCKRVGQNIGTAEIDGIQIGGLRP